VRSEKVLGSGEAMEFVIQISNSIPEIKEKPGVGAKFGQ